MERPSSLLVIVDPTASTHPAVERARQLAIAFKAGLELFVCYVVDGTEALHMDEHVLEKLANGLREQGIDVVTDESSAPTLYSGVVAKVLRSKPSLVIKDTHPHSLLRRSVLANTDWQLIRLCPAPLLFVRPGDWSKAPRIAAAVDVAVPGEKPASLDHQLLSIAESYAIATRGELHAVHAYQPVSVLAATVTTVGVPMAAGVRADRVIEDGEALARIQFDEVLSAHPVPRTQRQLVAGAPAQALVEFVRRNRIDLLVMGAFSRGWMYNVFVGSTTERILDLLPCDVLVVKPDGFECPIAVHSERALEMTRGD